MAKMVSVNGGALKYAREYYSLTVEEVSEKTKIKSAMLEQYESGNDFPTYAQLEKLSDYYNKPLFYFFSKDIEKYDSNKALFRRVGNRQTTKRIKELIESANIYKMNLVELYQGEDKIKFADIVKQSRSEDKNEFSQLLRKSLDLDMNAQFAFNQADKLLEYLRDKLYDIGIYVFKDSFKDNEVSGLCIYDDTYPIVLLNNKTTFTRQLFTLFHEIYHIYLREADIDFIVNNEESDCNEFASLCLIPEDDFREQIKSYDDLEDMETIQILAKRYCVSKDAIMYRLVKMGELDMKYYQDQKVKVNYFRDSNLGGGNFYFTRMSYLGNAYLNKVFQSYYSGKITKAQVGIYTNLKPIHISKLASTKFGGVY